MLLSFVFEKNSLTLLYNTVVMKIIEFKIDMYEEVYSLWKKTELSLVSSDTKEEVERIVKLHPELFLVGIKGQKIIAVVIGAFDGRRGYVHHLSVDPNYQKQGLGKIMMEELHSRFKKMKIHKVHLFVEADNMGVIEYYKKIGWHIRSDLVMMSYVPDTKLYTVKKHKKQEK